MESTFRNLLTAIDNNKNSIVLATHKNPDGDGLGCMFAMGEVLERRGHVVHYVLESPPKKYYQDIFPLKKISYQKPLSDAKPLSDKKLLFLSFDCSSPDIISLPANMQLEEYDYINIDHHVSNLYFANINVVDSGLASCCELIFNLLQYMREDISPNIATALYAGLVFDTGRFAYSDRPESFQAAANLLKAGARHWDVFNSLFRHNSLQHFKTNALLIGQLKQYKKLPLIYLHITADFIQQIDAEESEDLVNYMSNIKDLEVLAVFRFIDENITKVSLRSRGRYSVANLALALGGGGHAKASGAMILKNLQTTSEEVLESLEQIILHG